MSLIYTQIGTRLPPIWQVAEDWLYSDDGFNASKSVYAEKLGSITKFGQPIERRMVESAGRQSLVNNLRSLLDQYKSFIANAIDAKYSHISDEDRTICRNACNETESWLYDMVDKQADLPQYQDAVLTCSILQKKTKDLTELVTPIMYKPKPAPEQKKDESKKEEEKGGEAPMDTDANVPPPEPQNMAEEMNVD